MADLALLKMTDHPAKFAALFGDKELGGVGVPITLSDCGWAAASAQISAIGAATAIRRLAA